MRSKEYAPSYAPEELIQTLREFTRLRYELIKDRRNYERQTYSILSFVSPEYEKTALKNPNEIQQLIDIAESSIYSGRAKDARGIALRILSMNLEKRELTIKSLSADPRCLDGHFI
ncbi:MAG: IS110 family transposase [Candidatus Omnitrophica bacterium]|nr:IS110 family transposase [Candidatus Omnitrophota bacterium]